MHETLSSVNHAYGYGKIFLLKSISKAFKNHLSEFVVGKIGGGREGLNPTGSSSRLRSCISSHRCNLLLFRRPMHHASGCRRWPFGPRRLFSLNVLQSLPVSLAWKSESPLVMERAIPQARSVAAIVSGWKLDSQRHRHTRPTRRSPVGENVHSWSQC